ncbi:MAG: DUF7161 family protein [Segniliparus sp.]|uniref:DUF7161 family protein n=1 Tax=Segniliparus sp. TaxID=2804064 RepID=UPI003F3EE7CA
MPTDETVWERIDYDTEGLRDRVARILVDDPEDDVGYPAELPVGTTEVVILDDTPNVHLCLRVHVAGYPEAIAYIKYDQLAVEVPNGSARPGYAVPHDVRAVPLRDLPPLPPRELPPLPPVRESQTQQQ